MAQPIQIEPENRKLLLEARKLLTSVAYARIPGGRVRPKGSGVHCGACRLSSGQHAELCPVGDALHALGRLDLSSEGA